MKESFGRTEDNLITTDGNPIDGYCQCSEFALGGFPCLGSLIISAYQQIGHEARLTSSKAVCIFILAAVVYVDITDRIQWEELQDMEDNKLVEIVQVATMDFGKVAKAMEGDLKPAKCTYYFLSYHPVNCKT